MPLGSASPLTRWSLGPEEMVPRAESWRPQRDSWLQPKGGEPSVAFKINPVSIFCLHFSVTSARVMVGVTEKWGTER